jgi:hypothetical protein
VILGAPGFIEDNAFENFEEAEDFDFQSGLFADLAAQCGFETLAHFYDASGQRPVVFEGFAGALDEEDAIAIED